MPNRKNWDQAAGAIWPALTSAAAERNLLKYGEIAPLIPTNPLSVGRALGPIQSYCLDANIPPLTAIVVGKTTGLPGSGFVAWDIDNLEEGIEGVFRYPWDTIANPFTGFADGTTEAGFADELVTYPDAAEGVYSRIKNRGVAQRVFRRALLKAYDNKCCMCGLSFESALEAAHIVPWSESSPAERMDPRNGLLLCSTHHRMFDAAEITIDVDYKIEYFDPEGSDGPYSAADHSLSISLHGSTIRLPKKLDVAPSMFAVNRRRDMDEWE
jgi:putative restriction endonuclease